jgi:hypothetical protein
MSQRVRVSLLFSCAAAFVILGKSSGAAHAAPPKPAPPIYYHVRYFSGPGGAQIAAVRGMNNSGVMVGEYYRDGKPSGYLYDPVVNSAQAIDLNDIVTVPAGWTIAYAADVNDYRGLLVAIEKTSQRDSSQPDYEARGLLIDMRTVPWSVIDLPDAGDGVKVCFGRAINNNGDVVATFPSNASNIWGSAGAYVYNAGLYRDTGPDAAPSILPLTLINRSSVALNNPLSGRPLQVVGTGTDGNAIRHTVGNPAPQVFSLQLNASEMSINGYGVFCGRTRLLKKGSQYVSRPFCYDPDNQSAPTMIGSESTQAMEIGRDINDAGDVILDHYLYRNSTLVKIDDCVSGPSGDFWRNSLRGATHCTQRTDNGYPVLGAAVSNSGLTRGCLLTPKTSPQP